MYLKNNDTIDRTWSGQLIEVGAYYAIQSHEVNSFSSDATLLGDLATGKALISKDGLVDITNPSEGIDYIKGKSPMETYALPFSTKKINGKSLFKRVHGVKVVCSVGDNDIEILVPYNNAKLNKIEILWCDEGSTVSFFVYDTPTGTISTVPNYMLNQFGFNAGVSKDFYSQYSEYDADLIKDMKLKATVNIPNAKTLCVNFIFNELV